MQDRPNIVFVLVDDTGWDFGVYGGPIATPNIHRLAAGRVRLNNCTVESQRTPTRSAILTGPQPIRMGAATVPLSGQGEYGMSPWEHTLAELLSEAGYATAAFGKWHLGEVDGRLPIDQGFDELWGVKITTDEAGYSSYALCRAAAAELGLESPKIWSGRQGEGVTAVRDCDMSVRPPDGRDDHRTDVRLHRPASRLGRAVLRVGRVHPRTPAEQAHPEFDQTSPDRNGMYADIVAEMDHRVGQIPRRARRRRSRGGHGRGVQQHQRHRCIEAAPCGSSGTWRGNFFTPPFEASMRFPAIISHDRGCGAHELLTGNQPDD